MRRKYGDCQRQDGNCTLCSLINNGRDCHNRNITKLEWARLKAEMSKQQLSTASGINIRQIQKVELGEADAGNLTVRTMFALADALNTDPRNLF